MEIPSSNGRIVLLTIREVAVVTGKTVASCPSVPMGPLFFRQLENEKTTFLKLQYGNFDAKTLLRQRSFALTKG